MRSVSMRLAAVLGLAALAGRGRAGEARQQQQQQQQAQQTQQTQTRGGAALRALRASSGLRAGAATGGAADPLEGGVAKLCAQHKLCAGCLHEAECVWCASDGGSCVPGTAEDGPTGECPHWENKYCVEEPCTHYSGCNTCVADPFCGWSAAEKMCVEGDSKGPLTGTEPADSWKWGECKKGAHFGADAASPLGLDEASKVAKELEAEAKAVESQGKAAATFSKSERQDEEKAFNLIAHLKVVLAHWRDRKREIGEALEVDRELFKGAYDNVTKTRNVNFNLLLTAYQAMESSLAKDEEVQRLHAERVASFDRANSDDDNDLYNEVDSATGGAAAGEGDVVKLPDLNHTMHSMSNWLNSLSSREKHLLTKLGRKAGNNVQNELHISAVRKSMREEAGWYACQFLLESPDTNCMDFHAHYAGNIEKDDPHGLSEEEHMRVCNSVRSMLDNNPKRPHYKSEKMENGKDQYLQWCLNNIHM